MPKSEGDSGVTTTVTGVVTGRSVQLTQRLPPDFEANARKGTSKMQATSARPAAHRVSRSWLAADGAVCSGVGRVDPGRRRLWRQWRQLGRRRRPRREEHSYHERRGRRHATRSVRPELPKKLEVHAMHAEERSAVVSPSPTAREISSSRPAAALLAAVAPTRTRRRSRRPKRHARHSPPRPRPQANLRASWPRP